MACEPNHELGDGYTPAFCSEHSPEPASSEPRRPHLAVEFVREHMRRRHPGKAGVQDRLYTPFQSEPDAAPVRLIVRRVKPAPGSQLALFASYSYHGFITGRDGETLDLEADHRRHAEI